MLNSQAVPEHIGFILDGNRRWAKAQGLPTLEGHRKGYDNLKDIAKASFEAGVKYVSAFIFSTENWNRSEEETSFELVERRRFEKLQSDLELLKKEYQILQVERENDKERHSEQFNRLDYNYKNRNEENRKLRGQVEELQKDLNTLKIEFDNK